MLDRMAIETGVAIAPLLDTASWLQEQMGRPLPGMLMKAGVFPRFAAPRGSPSPV
jgi:hydroxymethylglutaryl-CoA lyase